MPQAALPAIISGVLGIGAMVDQNIQTKAAIKNNTNAQDASAAATKAAYGNAQAGLAAGGSGGNYGATAPTAAPTIGAPTVQRQAIAQHPAPPINAHQLLAQAQQNPAGASQAFTQLSPAAQQALVNQMKQSLPGSPVGAMGTPGVPGGTNLVS